MAIDVTWQGVYPSQIPRKRSIAQHVWAQQHFNVIVGVVALSWTSQYPDAVAQPRERQPGPAFFAPPRFVDGAPTSVALTGIGATSSLGTLLNQRSGLALTGFAATGSVGALGVSHTQPVSGLAVTASLGTVGWAIGIVRALTGVAGTGGLGTLGVAHDQALTGLESATSLGDVAWETGIVRALTGVGADRSLGTLGSEREVPVSGSAAAVSLGTIAPGLSAVQALSGIEATSALGTLLGQLGGVALTGTEAAAALGTLGIAPTKALTGIATAADVGYVAIPLLPITIPQDLIFVTCSIRTIVVVLEER